METKTEKPNYSQLANQSFDKILDLMYNKEEIDKRAVFDAITEYGSYRYKDGVKDGGLSI